MSERANVYAITIKQLTERFRTITKVAVDGGVFDVRKFIPVSNDIVNELYSLEKSHFAV